MQNFWEDEIHLWVIGLSAHHVDPSDEQDDVGSKHVMLSDHLLKGVEYHVLVLSDALWHISKDDLETAVKDAQSVVLTFQTDTIQDRRNNQRQELLTVFSNMLHDVHDSCQNYWMMVN